MLRLAGELATFATPERRARDYPAYDHDDLENVFAPLIRDIQDFLSARLGRRAIRLEIIERAQNAFVSPIRDRSLFRNATLVLEVAARRPLIEIQNDFPHLFKIGPNTKMNEIVHANLPGVPLVHLPTPPPHIRAITDHVYFYLDRKSPLWPEFSTAGIDRDAFLGRLAGTRTASLGNSGRPAMSDKDKPANPFGRVERTIIRPNPGGRLPQAPAPPVVRRSPQRPAPVLARRRHSQVPVLPPPHGRLCRAAPASLRRKTGYATPATPLPQHAAPSRAGPTACAADELVAPNANPIMRAAGPLLQLLGRLARGADARVVREPDGAGRRCDKIFREATSVRPEFPSIRPTPRNTFCARPPTISCSIFRPKTATSGRNTRC